MSSDQRPDGEAALVTADREHGGRRHPRSRLFAYCAASGVTGTAIATALSFAASGVAWIVVWPIAIGLVSLLAGLAYDSGPVKARWSTGRPGRESGDARPAASVR